MQDGNHWPSHPAKPPVIDKVVHRGTLGTELRQQLGLLWPRKNLVTVRDRLSAIEREILGDQAARHVHKLAFGGLRNISDNQRTHLRERGCVGPFDHRDEGRCKVEGIDAGK